MMNEIKSQLTIFFVLIGLFSLLTYSTPADEEYDFLKINYQYSKIAKDQSFDIDLKARLIPLSTISNYNKTFKLSTFKDFTRRKLMIVSKLSTRYEILDFLSTIKNMKGVFTMSIGMISETHFQLYKSELAEVSDFDIVSSLYFCTYKPSLINRTCAELFLKPNKCYELYAIKQTTILKVVPFQQPSNAHNIFEVLEPIFHEQAARRSNFRGVHIVAETVDYKFASHLSSFIRQPNSTNSILLKEGLEIEIFRCLRDALNFTEKAVESDGYLVMAEDKTVNNSGLAKFLHEDTADISISLAEYIPYRMSGKYGIRYLHSVYRSE
ncbi:unnamed protein product [Orchesella dallaii]|uniref:Uncharacterized protein n=1 Tax=Orchesella dallaii TaxID=48710 RepID=A0ABP1S379_9HEXA